MISLEQTFFFGLSRPSVCVSLLERFLYCLPPVRLSEETLDFELSAVVQSQALVEIRVGSLQRYEIGVMLFCFHLHALVTLLKLLICDRELAVRVHDQNPDLSLSYRVHTEFTSIAH